MAISEFEIKRYESIVAQFVEKHRPPPHLRSKVDLSFRLKNQSIELFEVRADWQDASQKIEESVAKATYNKSKNNWKVYWKRADMKWHSYPPAPEVKTLENFLSLVEQDEYACFFG